MKKFLKDATAAFRAGYREVKRAQERRRVIKQAAKEATACLEWIADAAESHTERRAARRAAAAVPETMEPPA